MKNIFSSLFLAVLIALVSGCQRKAAPASGSTDPNTIDNSGGNTKGETISEDVILLDGGKAKFHSGDSQGAIEELNKAIESNKKSADAFYWRAVAKCSIGDNAGCCEDYAKAQKLGHPSATEMIEKYCSK